MSLFRRPAGPIPAASLMLCVLVFLWAGCAGKGNGSKSDSAPSQESAQATDTRAAAPAETPAPAAKMEAPTMPENTVTTPSGLQYADLVVGTGASPKAGQLAVVHYTGWLTDGKKFDSSVDRGEPFTFPLGQKRVIAGWDEGVATMKVGGKRRLTIPANLAYGERGAGGVIPANATLIFDVELLDIR